MTLFTAILAGAMLFTSAPEEAEKQKIEDVRHEIVQTEQLESTDYLDRLMILHTIREEIEAEQESEREAFLEEWAQEIEEFREQRAREEEEERKRQEELAKQEKERKEQEEQERREREKEEQERLAREQEEQERAEAEVLAQEEEAEAETEVTTSTVSEETEPQQTSQAQNLLLAQLVESEAKGEPYAGKVAVAEVVLNRVSSGQFPDTIEGVIYQSGQFQVVSNGSINNSPSQASINAANQALNESNHAQGALFFYNSSIATDRWQDSLPTVTVIGRHTFKTNR